MTREEKIALLVDELEDIRCDNFDADTDEDKTLKEAVKAIKALQGEPRGDCIDRQVAIDAIQKLNIPEDMCVFEIKSHLEVKIATLPPVTPQPKIGRWIPVSEGLPKPFSYVNCTCRSLIDDRAFWVVETCYVPQPKNSPYSDWGNIPMLNHGDCAVVAWMYRNIPKPYKSESEGENDKRSDK